MINPPATFRLPHEGESALHYCETIAHTHGWQSINQFMSACGQKPITNWHVSSKALREAILATISPFEGAERIESIRLMPPSGSQKQLKVCLLCLRDKQPHLVKNQMPFNTHCVKHCAMLIDKCISCDFPIKSSIHSYCGACDDQLESVSDVHDYIVFSEQLGDERDGFLTSLLELAACLIRPWDIISETTNFNKLDNSQIHFLMKFAFDFLTTKDASFQYKQSLYSRHAPHAYIVSFLLDEKLNHVSKIALSCKQSMKLKLPVNSEKLAFDDIDKVLPIVVSSKRIEAAGNYREVLNTQCTAQQLAQLLGVQTRLVTLLVNKNVIAPLYFSNQALKMIFCIDLTFERISKYLPHAPRRVQRDYVLLQNISDVALAAYNVDKTDIIMAALSHEIPAYFDRIGKKDGGQFKVQVDSLIDFLNSRKSIDDHVPVDVFAKRLLVPVSVVSELIKACDDLYYAKYSKTGPLLIDQVAAESFLLNYVCLNREAWLYDIPMNDVRTILETCCAPLETIVFRRKGAKQEFVFLKNNECLSRNLLKIFADIPYRIFIRKFGRKQFPTVQKSLNAIELELLGITNEV